RTAETADRRSSQKNRRPRNGHLNQHRLVPLEEHLLQAASPFENRSCRQSPARTFDLSFSDPLSWRLLATQIGSYHAGHRAATNKRRHENTGELINASISGPAAKALF